MSKALQCPECESTNLTLGETFGGTVVWKNGLVLNDDQTIYALGNGIPNGDSPPPIRILCENCWYAWNPKYKFGGPTSNLSIMERQNYAQ